VINPFRRRILNKPLGNLGNGIRVARIQIQADQAGVEQGRGGFDCQGFSQDAIASNRSRPPLGHRGMDSQGGRLRGLSQFRIELGCQTIPERQVITDCQKNLAAQVQAEGLF
jgi:hypothetical protein